MTMQAAINAPAMAQPMPIPTAAPLEMLLLATLLVGLVEFMVLLPLSIVLLLLAIVVWAPPSQLSVVKRAALRSALEME